jgi:hypothetical protein
VTGFPFPASGSVTYNGSEVYITYTPVNNTNTAQTVTFTITPQYTFNGVTCPGIPINVNLVVNPAPTATLTGLYSCATGMTTLNIAVAGTGPFAGVIEPGSIPFSGTGPGTVSLQLAQAMLSSITYSVSSLTLNGCNTTNLPLATVTVTAVTPGTTGTWTCGAGDGDWFNPCNWANGIVPDNTIDVVINSATSSCNPVINPNSPYSPLDGIARSRNITIQGTSNLSFIDPAATAYSVAKGGGSLHVAGNWINQVGTAGFTANTGTVTLMGSTVQNVTTTGGVENFYNLVINNTSNSPSGGVEAGSQLNVSGVFTLTQGVVLTTATNIVNITNCEVAAVVGGSTASYVNGPIRRCTNSTGTYVFPVGNPAGTYGVYRPALVQPTTGNNTVYTGQYHTGQAPNSNYSGFLGGSLVGVLGTEYWSMSSGANTCPGTASIGLPYINPNNDAHWYPNISGSPSTCFTCNVGVVKSYNPTWYLTDYPSLGTGFSSSRPEYRYWQDQGIIWSKDAVDCQANPYFSFGFTYNIILPVQLLTFDATLQGADALLKWTIADNKDVQVIEVEYSADGRNFRRIGTVRPGATTAYEFVHPGLSAGVHYYRILLRDVNGQQKYSRVATIVVGRPRTIITGLLGNPVHNEATVEIISAKAQGVQARLLDKAGRVVRSQRFTIAAGKGQIKVATLFLAGGMYTLQVTTDDGAFANLRMLRE